jgi:GT2 family glycosyltransferase
MYCENKDGKIKPHFAKVSYALQPVQQEAVWNGVIEKDTLWAFPNALSAKEQMREVYKNHDRFRGQAKRLAAHIEKEFEESKINEMFVDQMIGKSNIKPQDFNGVSFCIPTNGKRPEKTELTIKSIKAQTGKPVEIIVCGDVDNFRHIEGITFIDRKEDAHSRKVAVLRNKAAEVAKYDVIAWCDDDVIIGENWLANTIKFSSNKGWNVLGNKVLLPDGSRYWDRATLNPHTLVDYEHFEYDKELYQSSAFLLVRKQVFENVKWDENCLVYADREGQMPEDVKYSIDLKNKNYTLSFNKESLVWHNDDSYTEFNNGVYTLTLKKDLLREKMDMHFFLPNSLEFTNYVGNVDA